MAVRMASDYLFDKHAIAQTGRKSPRATTPKTCQVSLRETVPKNYLQGEYIMNNAGSRELTDVVELTDGLRESLSKHMTLTTFDHSAMNPLTVSENFGNRLTNDFQSTCESLHIGETIQNVHRSINSSKQNSSCLWHSHSFEKVNIANRKIRRANDTILCTENACCATQLSPPRLLLDSDFRNTWHHHLEPTNRQFRESSDSWRCMYKTFLLVISLGAVFYLGCRLHDWFSRYKLMRNYYVYHNLESTNFAKPQDIKFNQSTRGPAMLGMIDSNSWTRTEDAMSPMHQKSSKNGPVLKICNINPLRGTSVFMFQNGSQLYDTVSQMKNMSKFRSNEFDGEEKRTLILAELVARAGHRIDEMLKKCVGIYTTYQANDFSSLLTEQGLCYLLQIPAHVSELEFLMDPQEYDYIVPHHGLTGFRVSLYENAVQARATKLLDLRQSYISLHKLASETFGIYSNEAFVTPEFHTFVRYGLETQQLQRNEPNCLLPNVCARTERKPDQNRRFPELENDENANQPPTTVKTRVVSVTQAYKSVAHSRLLSFEHPQLFNRRHINVALGLRIQQRAYLKLVNSTAYSLLQKLADSFQDLRIAVDKTMKRFDILYNNLQEDQRIIDHKTSKQIGHCPVELNDHFTELMNTFTNFQKSLCTLENLRAFSLQMQNVCGESKRIQENIKAHDDLAWFNLLLDNMNEKMMDLGAHVSSFNKPTPPTDIDLQYTQPRLAELQVIDLFFTADWSSTELRDILRGYLRALSTDSMKLQLQFAVSLNGRAPAEKSYSKDATATEAELAGKCDARFISKLADKYRTLSTELGEILTESIQRLESFTADMNLIVQANVPIVKAFRLDPRNHDRLSHTSLVSFTVQIEKSSWTMGSQSLAALATTVSPLSEISGICFEAIGLLLIMILSTDYVFKRWVITRRP